jgi:nitrogen regulatory protein P-II 2
MTLPRHPKKLLVIVAEAELERALANDARELGAQGWTIQDVRSAAREGVREGAWESDRTIEMKVICDDRVADAIAERVLRDYAPHYSVAIWFSDVQVLRPERY